MRTTKVPVTPARKRVRTHGLTHINLAVRDLGRSLRFYQTVFGVKEYYRDGSSVQVLGPGPHDVLAFERNARQAGKVGGITHFGFRLKRPQDVQPVVEAARAAGGRLLRRGEFSPGYPSRTSPIRTGTRSRSGTSSPADH